MAQLARTSFRERIETLEDEWLSPLAMRSYPAVREDAGARLGPPHAVPARPRPDRALEAVPAPEAQDAGVHLAGGRPLPHPAHAHARGVRDRARGGAGARAERGPHRGDLARPRPRPPALRPHRRGGARRLRARARGERFPPQRAFTPCGGRARAAEPDGAGARRHPAPHGRRAAGDARGADRPAGGPGGVHQPRHRRRHPRRRARASRTCRAPRSSCSARPGRSGSRRWWWTCCVIRSEAADIVQGEEVGSAMLRLRSFMFERVYLGRARPGRAAAHRADDARAVRPPPGSSSATSRP